MFSVKENMFFQGANKPIPCANQRGLTIKEN